jgi:2-polyprenyl-6-methoxyphenol hydroxylase-like FAD-dependent oxidoreductase
MTVEEIPQYDGDGVAIVGEHAVVVGGSMAGLIAARVLADAFERVTVLERDAFPDDPRPRRGVPQGHHVHAMLEAGRNTLEDLFPGYSDDLVSAGAVDVDLSREFNFYDEGDFVASGSHHLSMYCASRPLIEHVTRRRLAAIESVSLRDKCHLTGYLTDSAGAAVDGVTIRNQMGDREEIGADLVVDCTGRTSSTPDWLADRGYRRPPEDEVQIDLAYSTILVERPSDDTRAFHVMPCPPRARSTVTLPIENDRWVVTLSGVHGDHPPADVDGMREFAESLPVDAIATIVEEHEVVSDGVKQYPFPANLRRRYWELERFPDGLVVLGDAIASFNPIYGQGMSLAALEGLHLHHALAEDGQNDLAVRLFDRVESVVDNAWNVSVSSDFRFEETAGPKPPGTDLLNRYLSRMTRKAHHDGTLADAYTRVVTMEKPPTSLLRPRIAWRVLRPSLTN